MSIRQSSSVPQSSYTANSDCSPPVLPTLLWIIVKNILEERLTGSARSSARMGCRSALQSTKWLMSNRQRRWKHVNHMRTSSVVYRFSFRFLSMLTKTVTLSFHWFRLLGERKKVWLIKIGRNKVPQFKAGNGIDCGKDRLAFDLVTHWNG